MQYRVLPCADRLMMVRVGKGIPAGPGLAVGARMESEPIRDRASLLTRAPSNGWDSISPLSAQEDEPDRRAGFVWKANGRVIVVDRVHRPPQWKVKLPRSSPRPEPGWRRKPWGA